MEEVSIRTVQLHSQVVLIWGACGACHVFCLPDDIEWKRDKLQTFLSVSMRVVRQKSADNSLGVISNYPHPAGACFYWLLIDVKQLSWFKEVLIASEIEEVSSCTVEGRDGHGRVR